MRDHITGLATACVLATAAFSCDRGDDVASVPGQPPMQAIPPGGQQQQGASQAAYAQQQAMYAQQQAMYAQQQAAYAQQQAARQAALAAQQQAALGAQQQGAPPGYPPGFPYVPGGTVRSMPSAGPVSATTLVYAMPPSALHAQLLTALAAQGWTTLSSEVSPRGAVRLQVARGTQRMRVSIFSAGATTGMLLMNI